MKKRPEKSAARYPARSRIFAAAKKSGDLEKDLRSLLRNPSIRERLERLRRLFGVSP